MLIIETRPCRCWFDNHSVPGHEDAAFLFILVDVRPDSPDFIDTRLKLNNVDNAGCR